MHVGFTGTRQQMSVAQQTQLTMVLAWLLAVDGSLTLHHGGAQGADTLAGLIAEAMPGVSTRVHRPTRPGAAGLLARNRDIVDAVEILIAAPETDREELRSGTWATIRYARRRSLPVIQLSRGGR